LRKIENNQGFKTIDLFLVIGSIMTVIAVIGPILHNHVQSESKHTALNSAKDHAKDLLSKFMTEEDSVRTPASENSTLEGPIGTDPWGQSYNFKVLRDSYGQPTHVLVWSKGPNKIRDTSERVFLTKPGRKTSSISFEGDDLGYVVGFR